ncbi:uncharacterized protein LOC123548301 isoform X2 [Mercenaria mercenaria]|uniref:uncharacterized protein LOC123548301 isoform X2 n=1 Tax=Mercenaria mercenaria TaxID=6596 RepID=UPI00234EF142|nr:uncharacterized protein LOC123548301 isoform X2 [Mercenaria mercenaria]
MSAEEIQVFIKGISASTSTIRIAKNATIAELFQEYSEHIGLTGTFGLVYGGKELKETTADGKVMHLKDYGIEDESNIGAVLRLPGGSGGFEKRYGNKVKLSKRDDMLGIDDQAVDMPCGHAIGPNSMTWYVKEQVGPEHSKYQICCPAVVDDTMNETCKQPWGFKKVKKVALFTKDERTDVEGKISNNYIRIALKSKVCPKCESFCVRQNKANPRVVCTYCTSKTGTKFEFCWACLRQWKTSGTSSCGNDNCEDQSHNSTGTCASSLFQNFRDMIGRWRDNTGQFFMELLVCYGPNFM